MAHIKVERSGDGTPRLFINDVDMTNEIYAGTVSLVSHGDEDETAELALQLRIAVGQIDIGDHEDVDATALFGALVRPAPSRRSPLYGEVKIAGGVH